MQCTRNWTCWLVYLRIYYPVSAFVYKTHGFIKVDLFEDEIKVSTFFANESKSC